MSAYSRHKDEAMKAIECITSPDNQGVNAELTGNMPASAAGYRYPALAKIYPQPLLALFQQSLDAAAPRTVTPYWGDISGASEQLAPARRGRRQDPAGHAEAHRGRAARKEPAVRTVTYLPGEAGDQPARKKGQRPGARREQARPTTGGAGRDRDAGRHRVADDPGPVPLVVPLPAHAPDQGVRRPRELRDGAHGHPVLAGHLNTVLIMVITVAVELVIGFAFAMVMHRILFARGIIRTAILIPYGIVTVVSAYAWQFAFILNNGWVNTGSAGCPGSAGHQLVRQPLARDVRDHDLGDLEDHAVHGPAPARRPGADLGGHDRSREVDGATWWQRLRKVILPNMRAAIIVAVLFRALDAFRIFDSIYVMTEAPRTPSPLRS